MLSTAVPLLLLPVRLETRFKTDQSPYQLLIRIYPDVVHIDSFERGLSEMEVQWGEHFLEQTRAAEGDPDKQLNAWAQLAQVFGPRRAAWIAGKFSPTNQDGFERADPTKLHTPCTRLLPDHWIASGKGSYTENAQQKLVTFSERGREVKYADGSDCIYVLPRLDQPWNGQTLQDDPHAGWLVDFEKAEAIGMGIRVSNLPNVNLRIDQLLVYGVKASLDPDPEEGKRRVETLLDAHHYTQGLAFVAQGTPTNNTLSAPSGYDSGDHGSRDSFKIERQQAASENVLANHRIMAQYLGINSELLVNVQDATTEEQQDARDMNDVLWKATWKRFLEELLALNTPEKLNDIENMREHFTKYVRARGPLPALRIGSQPYGILPVMALGETGHTNAVNTRSAACLRELREIWRAALKNKELVPRLTTDEEDPDPSLTLLRILAIAPTGLNYVGRNSTRIVPASSEMSEDGFKKTGRTVPPALQKALDSMFGPNIVTPHQRTVFTTHAGLCSLGYELTREDDFDPSSGNTSLFNLLRDKSTVVEGLSKLKAPVRAQLLRETLDLASHRLDAWITSLATERLDNMRPPKGAATGLSIGGYGWLENLVPESASSNNEKYEFLHAPSLAHATTAALLRSGYLARRKKAASSESNRDSNAVAVNLSSDRIRLALHLVDGVRGGQSLGTLLGYRFERALHEQGLDQYIPRFRDLAPGSTDLVPPGTLDDRTTAKLSHLVLDGFELVQMYRNAREKIPTDLFNACEAQLRALDEAIDAVADLVLAESVHHVAQGNHVRAGATLEAIARGETPPPELDFVRTPRTGMNHTHRIGVVFGPPSNETPWGISTPRAQAEPALNHWVGNLLGAQANDAVCKVTYTDPTMNEKQTVLVTIKDLELAPLDLVYLFDSEVGGHHSEIEQRILYHVQKDKPAINTIELEFDASQGTTPPAMGEVLEVARSLRRLMTGARALEPRDIDLPENVVEATPDVDPSLIARASAARTAFQVAKDLLRAKIPANPDTPIADPPAVWTALKALATYGIIGAIPVIPVNQADQADLTLKRLRSQAQGVLEEATARDTRAQSITIETTAQGIAVLKVLFGEHFSVLPVFIPRAENGRELEQTFTSPTLQDTADLESMTWFQRIARVRDGAARLDTTMQYAEAHSGISLTFRIGQLPYQENEPWIALPSDTLPQHNRLSLVCIFSGERNFAKPLSGLLIEEWVETIPNKEELTGITFRYDAPQPRAPQALLLAVAPESVTTWDESALETLLSETLELAKLRAVDLTALGELGQYLPAMYVDASRIPIDFRLPLEKGSA